MGYLPHNLLISNFFGISNQIDYIIEDNKLKDKKFIPGVKIPIYYKDKIDSKLSYYNSFGLEFFEDIKKNNKSLSENFINIKDLENFFFFPQINNFCNF